MIESTNEIGYHELKRLQYLRLRLAVVIRVDHAKMTVDLKYRQEPGSRSDVVMSAPYWSAQAYMGVMPEEGAQCIVGFYHQGADVWRPVILTWLPTAALAARRIESHQIGLPPEGADDPRNAYSYIQRMRLRKHYPGQVLHSSKEGSDFLLSDDVLLSNSMGNEALLRADDQSFVTNTVGYSSTVSGGLVRFGPIARNSLVLDHHFLREGSADYNLAKGTALVDPTQYQAALAAHLIRPITLPNGKRVNYICDLPLSPDDGPNPFSEHRIEVFEYNPLSMRYTEDTDHLVESDDSFQKPLIEHVMGTLVGSDARNGQTYGRVLKPVLYSTLTDPRGRFRLEEAVHSFGMWRENELHTSAVGYYLRVGSYQQAITKSGSVFISIPSSTQSGPLGAGHSLHADLAGAAKVSIGREAEKGTSLYLTTEGSIKAVVGAGKVDTQGEKGRSLDLTAAGGINLEVLGTDQDDYSLRTVLVGKEHHEVGRDLNLTVKGNYNLVVHGVINEQILGKKVENYVADKHTAYGGVHSETVVEDRQTRLGKGRTETIATKGDSLTILAGNKTATLVLGNLVETVLAGNSIESITAGSKSINIVAGAYTVTVGTGTITVSTAAGSVNIGATAGAVTITASGVVQVTGGVINVTGGQVNLGPAPAAGVVTTLHPCLVTGAPHLGSLTVRASL